MVETFHTLHDYMMHTENITYVLMGLFLIGIVGFWLFLTERDD